MTKAIVLMDLENVRLSLKSANLELDLAETRSRILALPDFERIVGQYAFADFQFEIYDQTLQRQLRSASFILIQCPLINNRSAAGKATDDNEIIYYTNWLAANCPDFDTVFLMSGDGHFMRAAQMLQDNGKKVVRVNPELLNCSSDLAKAAPDKIDLLAVKELPKTTISKVLAPTAISASRKAELTEILEKIYWEADEEILTATLLSIIPATYSQVATDHERLQIACYRVFLRVRQVLEIQAQKERPTAFMYIMNMITTESNFPQRPFLKLADGSEAFDERGDEVHGLNTDEIKVVVNAIIQSSLIERSTVLFSGKEMTTYTLNRGHYFVRSLEAAEAQLRTETEESMVITFS